MNNPVFPWAMGARIITKVLPDVRRYLGGWEQFAERIPEAELRRQALASIETKTFHCEGGAIYALLAGPMYQETLKFIVAYQTISDYLDNLCDRSTGCSPDDFRALHEAMIQALTPGAPPGQYYRFHPEQNDGGYLAALVKTCQHTIEMLPAYPTIADAIRELAGYYCDLQVRKHMSSNERVQCLKAWFEAFRGQVPEISWYEFAASTGSPLGIFCLVAQASRGTCSLELVQQIKKAHFPWVQGLHILLDYLIDQEEDHTWGDLNFCSYYPNKKALIERLSYFYKQANLSVARLPNARFHFLINRGLLGLYLTDLKVARQRELWHIARTLLLLGGSMGLFFSVSCWLYRRLRTRPLSTNDGNVKLDCVRPEA